MSVSSLLRGLAKVSVFGFGGGSALIPVVERELVRNRGLVKQPVFDEHIVVSNITPGALPVKLGMAAGLHLFGARVSFLAALAVTLPGTAVMITALAFLNSLPADALVYMKLASVGILAFIMMILFSYIRSVQRNAEKSGVGRVAFVSAGLAFLLTAGKALRGIVRMLFPASERWLAEKAWFDWSSIHVLLLAFAVILATTNWRQKTDGSATAFDARRLAGQLALFLGVPLAFCVAAVLLSLAEPQFFGTSVLSVVTSFGGGEAYIAVADGAFTSGDSAYIAKELLYTQLWPVSSALPGPVLIKVLSGVGYLLGASRGGVGGGVFLATTCMLVGIGGTGAVFSMVYAVYKKFSGMAVFTRLKLYILPVIGGLLLSTVASMVQSMLQTCVSVGVPSGIGFLIIAGLAAVGVLLSKKCPDAVCVLVLGGLSVTVLCLMG